MNISVIIPCYNEEKNIAGALEALCSQETDFQYEIIVVDSSFDQTPSLIENQFPDVKLFHHDGRLSCGEARNKGIALAQGGKILFTDADVRVPSDWVQRMGGLLENYDVVGGSMRNGNPQCLTGTILYYLEFFRILPGHLKRSPFYFIGGANVGYRKKVLDETPFIFGSTGEDIALNFQLKHKNMRSMYDASIAVVHMNKKGLKRILRYLIYLGEGGYRWRSNSGERYISLKYPCVMLLKPILLLLYLYYDRIRNNRYRECLYILCLMPLLVIADYWWYVGFSRTAKQNRG